MLSRPQAIQHVQPDPGDPNSGRGEPSACDRSFRLDIAAIVAKVGDMPGTSFPGTAAPVENP